MILFLGLFDLISRLTHGRDVIPVGGFNVVDECTRQALAMRVARSCTADRAVDVIDSLVHTHGAPAHLRMDNGPEMIAWALRDYCRMAGIRTTYIEPGSPWQNPFARIVQRPRPRRAAQRRGL